MSDESNRRRYSEEEFALILRKAAEIRELPRDEGGTRGQGGFSLEEMQSIAREVGIDPGAVSRAAALMDAARVEEGKGWLRTVFGVPWNQHFDLEVPGRLDALELRRIVDVIRREASQQGEAVELLGGVEWKSVGNVSEISVNLSPRGNATSVQVIGNRGAAGFLTWFFALIGAGFGSGVLGSILEPTTVAGILALVGGMTGGSFLAARGLWRWTGRRFQGRLTRLMEALSSEIQSGVQLSLPPKAGSLPED